MEIIILNLNSNRPLLAYMNLILDKLLTCGPGVVTSVWAILHRDYLVWGLQLRVGFYSWKVGLLLEQEFL